MWIWPTGYPTFWLCIMFPINIFFWRYNSMMSNYSYDDQMLAIIKGEKITSVINNEKLNSFLLFTLFLSRWMQNLRESQHVTSRQPLWRRALQSYIWTDIYFPEKERCIWQETPYLHILYKVDLFYLGTLCFFFKEYVADHQKVSTLKYHCSTKRGEYDFIFYRAHKKL